MKIDHIAFRVSDRQQAVALLGGKLGYETQAEFKPFDDCDPPDSGISCSALKQVHDPIEVFVSDGPEGSIVGKWVDDRDGLGGIHHIAFAVEDVVAVMAERRFEFTTREPIICPEDDLVQCFTKPIPELGGVVFEFIQRGLHGFCENSVARLMRSSEDDV